MKLNTAKKLTAGALALSMMFAMAVPMAFATDEKVWTKEDDYKTVDIKKVYTAVNAGTTNPAETFYLKQIGSSVTGGDAQSAPPLEKLTGDGETDYIAKVSYTEGEATKEKPFTIQLPEYTKVGVYEYTLEEVAGDTAGVTYRTDTLKLVVTVINVEGGKIRVAGVHTESTGKEKSDKFDDNKYSAGSLNVKKVVEGNLGDKNKKFAFTVVFTNNTGKEIKSAITATVAGRAADDFNIAWDANKQYTYKFSLAHDETATFANLPYGVTYTVTETDYTGNNGGYLDPTPAYSEDAGTHNEIDTASETLTITNTKTGDVDTGVILDNAPYILMLAVVAGGAMTLVIKKRREEE